MYVLAVLSGDAAIDLDAIPMSRDYSHMLSMSF